MTELTTTPTEPKASATAKVTETPKATRSTPAAKADTESEVVTLDQLAREMKVAPREARMMLRLAAKQTKTYPTLGKEHVARQPWQWTPGSKALAEARKALSTPQEA
jgi:hypothetical protein